MIKYLAVFLIVMTALELNAQEKKILNGFDGGMMIHLGNHWRIGTEGYMSALSQLNNGSYAKYGWGGFLGDFYWRLGRFIPYVGLTIGGGTNTNLLILGEKQGFFALDPFLGCDFVVSESFRLTLKTDWLNCINKAYKIPSGPRLYLGFIFYH